jgi:hypothetical protein
VTPSNSACANVCSVMPGGVNPHPRANSGHAKAGAKAQAGERPPRQPPPLLEALPAYADTTPRPVLDRRTVLTSPPAATAPRPTIAAFRPLSSPHRPALHLAFCRPVCAYSLLPCFFRSVPALTLCRPFSQLLFPVCPSFADHPNEPKAEGGWSATISNAPMRGTDPSHYQHPSQIPDASRPCDRGVRVLVDSWPYDKSKGAAYEAGPATRMSKCAGVRTGWEKAAPSSRKR